MKKLTDTRYNSLMDGSAWTLLLSTAAVCIILVAIAPEWWIILTMSAMIHPLNIKNSTPTRAILAGMLIKTRDRYYSVFISGSVFTIMGKVEDIHYKKFLDTRVTGYVLYAFIQKILRKR